MKKLVFLLLPAFLFSCTNKIIARKIYVQEYYYLINYKGEVSRDKTLEKRTLVYDKKFELISSQSSPSDSISGLYYRIPQIDSKNSKYDENNRIIEYSESQDKTLTRTHYYTYNEWGDLLQDKQLSTDRSGKIVSQSILSYEYTYLDEFVYAKKNNKNYISGRRPNYDSTWALRIIKKDGIIVQYTERKISK